MQRMHEKSKDKLELCLDEMIQKVQTCQEEKNHKSCSRCEHFFGCELRSEYIKAVYKSMSKGETGGFEF